MFPTAGGQAGATRTGTYYGITFFCQQAVRSHEAALRVVFRSCRVSGKKIALGSGYAPLSRS